MTIHTTYIIGAGASHEIGMPLGIQLKELISEILHIERDSYGEFMQGNYDLYSFFRRHTKKDPRKFSAYIKACQHICQNMPLTSSIDNFIDSHRDRIEIQLCGKMAIIKAILAAEKQSTAFFDTKMDFQSFEGTWYLQFFSSITENCRINDLPERFLGITLIIFNYDRTIEHFLLQALMSFYGLTEVLSAELVNLITIVHPYGTVGALSWQKNSHVENFEVVPFGGYLLEENLAECYQIINTFTEGSSTEKLSQFRNIIESTERIVFLGFSFHKMNIELLLGGLQDQYRTPKNFQCFATAYNISKNDQNSITASLQGLFANRIYVSLENSTCSDFFKNNSRSLSYS